MLTERLSKFLSIWCDIDADPQQALEGLAARPRSGFAVWLQDDLRAAILAGDLTPDVAYDLTAGGFDTQDDVDAWLRELWTLWFPGDPYPVAG